MRGQRRFLQDADPGEAATARCLTGAHVDALVAACVGRAGVGGRVYASPLPLLLPRPPPFLLSLLSSSFTTSSSTAELLQ